MTGKEENMEEIVIPTKLMYDNAKLPSKKFPDDAGSDGYVCKFSKIGTNRNLIPYHDAIIGLRPFERVACHLGISTEIPDGFFCDVRPRSGLALFEGLTILNTPGTIDTGYRGEWIAIVINLSRKQVKIEIGDRICQVVLQKKYPYKFVDKKEISKSERGKGGFGSTGKQ